MLVMGFLTLRIKPHLDLRQISLLLPSSPDYEYSGYITKTRIRYKAGSYDWADTDYSKPVSFHTHPTSAEFANIPSLRDIRSFLVECRTTTLIVGSSLVWIWYHTKKSQQIAKEIRCWENNNMVRYNKTRSIEQYISLVLRIFGFRKPKTTRPANWQKQLAKLGIESELLTK